MKVAALVVSAVLAAGTLAGCEKEQRGVAPIVHEEEIDARVVTIREVEFVNSPANEALTIVRITDEDGLASMVKYRFLGYHPELTVGAKASLVHTNAWRGKNRNAGSYRLKLCVNAGEGQICNPVLG